MKRSQAYILCNYSKHKSRHSRIAGIPEAAANPSVPEASDTWAVSGTQHLTACWTGSQRASHRSLTPTNDSFTLPSPVTGSEFMVATDTLMNVHSSLAVSVAIQPFIMLSCVKRWIFLSLEKVSVRKTSISLGCRLCWALFPQLGSYVIRWKWLSSNLGHMPKLRRLTYILFF